LGPNVSDEIDCLSQGGWRFMQTLEANKLWQSFGHLWGLIRDHDGSIDGGLQAAVDAAAHSADGGVPRSWLTSACPIGSEADTASTNGPKSALDAEITAVSDPAVRSQPLPDLLSATRTLHGGLQPNSPKVTADLTAEPQDGAGTQRAASTTQPTTDGSGATTVAALPIEALADNQPPTDVTLLAGQPFNENIAGAVVGTLSVTDPDAGDTHTYSVSDSRFEVVGNQLKLKDGVRLDFEKESQVSLDVTATDSGGLSLTRTFAISVDDVAEVRFAAFGDYGNTAGTQLVANFVDNLNVDFIITLGDNLFGSAPIDVEIGQFYSDYIGNYQGAFGPGSPINRFFPSLGNHDYSNPGGGVNASAYLDYFTLPGNERYYDYTMGPIHFFVLNSEKQEPDGRSPSSVQGQWLQSALANSTSPYNFVYFHRAPYASGSDVGSAPSMQWPFEQWGATAVLSGHNHLYERILRDADGNGIVLPYFVAGLGGATSGAIFDDPPVEGSAVRYGDDFGTMLIQACATSCTFEFWTVGGELIDSYTIDAIDRPPPRPPLFTTGDDVIDFNLIAADSYQAGSQYNALAGNDTVILPLDAAAASAAGYDQAQTFRAGTGNDSITGGGLNDIVLGEGGTDTLAGGAGDDKLDGGSSSDTLIGGAGNDNVNGGSSGDILISGLGDDLFDGGAGNDTIDYSAAASGVTVDLASGTATGEGNDTLLNVERANGSAFGDVITGTAGANILLGRAGNDALRGGDGNDTLTGEVGLDQLFGDAGHDTGKWDSADKFDGGTGFDTLDAILSSADTIDLRGIDFINLERIRTGSGKDTVTLSLNDVLSDTADNQFVADLASSSPDKLNIDIVGGWTATTPNATLGPTGVAAGISISGMTAYTFTNGSDAVTIFTNAEVVNAQILTS
jgi:hypothetical protein